MGRAREEMHTNEDYVAMRRIVIRMLMELERHPSASVMELFQLACESIQNDMEEEELTRKLEKDD